MSALPIPPEVKAHPSYSDGYWDGLEGEPKLESEPSEYYVGYEAGQRAAEIFAGAGFSNNGGGEFAISFTLDPNAGDEA